MLQHIHNGIRLRLFIRIEALSRLNSQSFMPLYTSLYDILGLKSIMAEERCDTMNVVTIRFVLAHALRTHTLSIPMCLCLAILCVCAW